MWQVLFILISLNDTERTVDHSLIACNNFTFSSNILSTFKSSIIVCETDLLCSTMIFSAKSYQPSRHLETYWDTNLQAQYTYYWHMLCQPTRTIFISFYCNLHAIFLHYIIILIGVIIFTFIVHRCWTHHGGSNIRGTRTFLHSTRHNIM